jgi:hypothetical protein
VVSTTANHGSNSQDAGVNSYLSHTERGRGERREAPNRSQDAKLRLHRQQRTFWRAQLANAQNRMDTRAASEALDHIYAANHAMMAVRLGMQ